VLRQRRRIDVTELGLMTMVSLLLVLVAGYLVWALPAVLYRADLLLWSETQYVGDIIKLRAGAPLYAPPSDLSSSLYTPGTGILTWLIASPLGLGESVAAFRMIQLGFVVVAALLANRSVLVVLELAGIDSGERPLWSVLRTLVFFLLGTNTLT